MQEALGGNAKTSLVIAVANAKEHVDESLQSLQFGSRAMHVATAAVVNEHADLKLVNAELASAMEQHIDSGGILSASLLARQEELESANARLRVSCMDKKDIAPPDCTAVAQLMHVSTALGSLKDHTCNSGDVAKIPGSQRLSR